ncbi:MAG: GT4 family glycosyltransferase PelF [Planctomycetota bacterium]|jgi:glycosyltransferase involved in cell wall biosynthesis
MRRPDVCLVLEGTYPFVKGGVSSWVHQLVTQLSDLTFTILHVSPKLGYYKEGPLYQMPENVLGFEEVCLHEYIMPDRKEDGAEIRKKVQRFRALVNDMCEGEIDAFAGFIRALDEEGGGAMNSYDLLQTLDSWRVLVETYSREAGEESFLTFFWTWRFANMPLFNVLAAKAPDAGVYHTISTGYAGVLAAACKVRRERSMLLTEHGIYTKERRIEINRAEWIEDWESGELVAEQRPPYFKRYWIRQFEMMGSICYAFADEIFTLYDGNKLTEIKAGADASRIQVVPNGIDLRRFGEAAEARDARPPNERFTVGFVGRVCPIKDVKTLVYASRLVADEVPDVLVRVMGPWDEDPEYKEECEGLVSLLDLEENVVFEGSVNVLEEYPKVDVVVLTSISEAQPLVILEAGAVGLPIVATDVGSCSELLFGRTLEDRMLGQGGIITPIANPGGTAEAILKLIREPETLAEFGANLKKRVNTFYDQDDMISAYHDIYERNLERTMRKEFLWPASASSSSA